MCVASRMYGVCCLWSSVVLGCSCVKSCSGNAFGDEMRQVIDCTGQLVVFFPEVFLSIVIILKKDVRVC